MNNEKIDEPKNTIIEVDGNLYYYTGKKATLNDTGERVFEFEPSELPIWIDEKGKVRSQH